MLALLLTESLAHWTFRWRKTKDRMHIKGLKFNVVSLASLGLSYATFVILSTITPEIPPHVPQLVGIIPATLANYFLNAYWTFKPADV